jgi:hypothetical protein
VPEGVHSHRVVYFGHCHLELINRFDLPIWHLISHVCDRWTNRDGNREEEVVERCENQNRNRFENQNTLSQRNIQKLSLELKIMLIRRPRFFLWAPAVTVRTGFQSCTDIPTAKRATPDTLSSSASRSHFHTEASSEKNLMQHGTIGVTFPFSVGCCGLELTPLYCIYYYSRCSFLIL